MCNRTGSSEEFKAKLPAKSLQVWRKANRGSGVDHIKGYTDTGPRSEHSPEGGTCIRPKQMRVHSVLVHGGMT